MNSNNPYEPPAIPQEPEAATSPGRIGLSILIGYLALTVAAALTWASI
jgi:hypothetical protein